MGFWRCLGELLMTFLTKLMETDESTRPSSSARPSSLLETDERPLPGSSAGPAPLFNECARKVNESLFELQEPPSKPTMIILFFHGFYTSDSSDVHLRTWESEDRSCIWPQKWLLEDFGGARVLYVSYNASLVTRKTKKEKKKASGTSSEGNLDMYPTVENLTSDLMEAQIGETPGCPIIMVGYCVGGLVIKQLCLYMNHRKDLTRREKEKTGLENFLGNLKLVYYYGTPHNGIPCIDRGAQGVNDNPLLKYFKALSREGSRLSFDFSQLARKHGDWRIGGLGEGKITESGAFEGVLVAPETSARDGDAFNVLPDVDHTSISKPRDKKDRRFYAFTRLLDTVVEMFQEKGHGHQCTGLPSFPINLPQQAQEIEEKLKHFDVLGFFGMGGIGKTTLAKQVYNNISEEFEYSCFIHDVKSIPLRNLEDYILTHFHRRVRKVDRVEWSELKVKKTLIVMDDVDQEDQLCQLPDLENLGTGSKVIMTSRNKEIFKVYVDHNLHEVSFLKEDEARNLFCLHAFGTPEIVGNITHVHHLHENVARVVSKCGGLPLTLEVMGRYLREHKANAKVWEETIHKLGQAQAIHGGQSDRVWASLRVSYEALAKEEQEMFIEAATFFYRNELEYALDAWSTSNCNLETTRWMNLVTRALVKGDGEGRVWVHEQLRDLATYLAEGKKQLADSNMDMLNCNEMNEDTTMLRVIGCGGENRSVEVESIARLHNLKYLSVHDATGAASCHQNRFLPCQEISPYCIGILLNLCIRESFHLASTE